ncbi:hypothetical protein DFQ14_10297 [Halopolyspora algeriensis]|uniref:Uncharacterized protein n=1 Tax=Halopolyspora algeriensis TaxID=1500506 RepID=A0A368VUL2_9ACTN|nr:hypothetical protein [Halopolyspora algeriensis]RCW45796.1 hypothetical protein DFQ14_10297 [Halopolyspora algeriensis]TQM54180.1 hypothetical protein FHU43_2359 [Halopolyspora algeriensis]
MSSLEQARHAKRELRRRLAELADVVGIGVAREQGAADSYAVVVRLSRPVGEIPRSVRVFDTEAGDVDVTVHTEIVGPLRPE